MILKHNILISLQQYKEIDNGLVKNESIFETEIQIIGSESKSNDRLYPVFR